MESKKINQLATSVSPQTSDLTIIGDPVTGVSKKITLLQIANLFATTGTVSSVAVTETGDALTITGSPITSAGTINIGFAGDATQYVRGDGALADFPTSTGGGSSVSYYLNSSVSQGTIGGVAYRELSKEPVIGAGTDITASTNGYIASYITDANDPSLLEVPGGNFNCEFYFSVNSNNHDPSFYAELYKYDGTTFTLLGSSVGVPEFLTQGTTIAPYYFAIPVATAALTITDRLAIRIYVNVDTRVVTLHTENGHLCQVVTTFSKGLTSLNNLTRQVQFLATGTSGTDFAISSSTATHTFNLPVASATNTGKLSSTDWSTFNGKVPYTGATADVDLGAFILSAGATSSNIVYANGSGSSSGMLYLKQGTIAANYTGYNGIYATSTGYGLISDTGASYKNAIFSLASLTNVTPRTYTLPDLSGTLALLEGTQTFSGAKTFSLDITVNSVKVGRGNGSISTNSVLGETALNSNTTGSTNTAIGYGALQLNTTGLSNTAIGHAALNYNTTSSWNTAVGVSALGLSTGGQNTAIGYAALGNNTTGVFNIAIGYTTGTSIVTGNYNTIIGNYAGTAAMSNNIVLADGAGNIRYQWDGTNNVFGNPISGTSATFSSSVTGVQGIFSASAGTYAGGSLILKSSTGTNPIYLTSNGGFFALSNGGGADHLIIASTGAATFSSSVSAATNFISVALTDSISVGTSVAENAKYNYLGHSGYWGIKTTATGFNFALDTYNGGTPKNVLTITQGGAATFSSSVTANSTISAYYGSITSGNTPATSGTTPVNPMLNLTNNRGIGMFFGGKYSGDYAQWIQVSDVGNLGVNYPLLLNPNGGNVGIGTSSPSVLLHLAKASAANQLWLQSTTGTNPAYMNFINSGGNNYFGVDNSTGTGLFATGGAAYGFSMVTESAYPILFGTNNTERMRISSAGVVTITGLGTGTVTATSGVLSAVSDMNLKIEDGFIDNALEKVLKLKPRYYHWKEESGLPTDLRQLGFYAQEVNEALGEEAANTPKKENDKWGIYDRGMIAFLTAAIQEQQAQIEELKALIKNK